MKIVGFKLGNEKKFVHIFCNFIIVGMIVFVGAISIISPVVSAGNFDGDSAIYRGNYANNNITLMINVYWGNEYLEPMLKTLKDNDVKTTFFVGGSWAKSYTDLLQKIYDDGHEIANHGYNHKDHAKLSLAQNQEEIYSTHTLIEELIDVSMNLFAPPSGSYNLSTIEIANNFGYQTIMWSKDTIDWRDKNKDLIYGRATKNLKNGDLILMHPTEKTMQALDEIIKEIKRQGFNLTTVTQNIA